jgi:DNA-binding transcriptional ArsR family regulator
MRILAACNQGEVTPKEIAVREKMRLDTVGQHFRRLERAGYLRISRRERARGFLRNYYVAARQAIITDEEFERMSPERRRALSEAVLRDFLISYAAAQEAGTLSAGSDRHVSWRLLLLDEPAWKELMSELARLLEFSLQVQTECKVRLRRTEARPIQTILALAGFEGSVPGTAVDGSEVWDFLVGCNKAMQMGTLDARTDSHLSWSPLPLDRQGRNDLIGRLHRLVERALALQAEAQVRLRQSEAEPIPTVLGIAGFEGVAKFGGAGSRPGGCNF